MRYLKDSIAISEQHDIPLLLLVRNAGFITHKQLVALGGHDRTQSAMCSFLRRIRRLLAGDYIMLLDQRFEGNKIYAITRKGLEQLELFGHLLASLNPEMPNIHNLAKVLHCLELNDIRLTFLRHNVLNYWLTDLEVCSENLLTEDIYVKDYDALVGLTFGTSDLQCAIEYERSTKSAARYVDIRRQLAKETMVHAVIYIVKGVERILSIVERLSSPNSRVFFVTSSAFLRFGPDAYAMHTPASGGALREFLTQMAAMPIQGRTDLQVS